MTTTAKVHARAAIISVGDELTLGQTLDTNSKWLSEKLLSLGVMPVEHVTVPDDEAAQSGAMLRLAERADLIVITGGLGPTADDLTRRSLAMAMNDTLVEDELSLAQIEAWYSARGSPMPPLNAVQALRPSRGRSLPNLHGTAPGLHGAVGGCDVYCLPGPPGEMFPMFETQVAPRLRPRPGVTVRVRFLHTFGLGESALAQRLGNLMDRTRNPLVGTTASKGIVTCRLRYEGPLPPMEADTLLDETERQIRMAAGSYIFASGDQTLAGAVLESLKARGETLGVVESCTGGLLGSIITEVPGSSAAFVGGLITYANAMKAFLADVPGELLSPPGPGAVSREVALAMARGGLSRLGCDHAVAITGIAGPDGAVPSFAAKGSNVERPAKPVGTVYVARASRDGSDDVRAFAMGGNRMAIRDWAARAALGMLLIHVNNGDRSIKLLRQVEP